MIVLAQARHSQPSGPIKTQARHSQPSGPIKSLSNKNEEDYNVYKPYLIFFGIIDGIYKNFFKNVAGTDEQWPSNLADYIRHNDEALMKASERLLGIYTDELLPCTSFAEFCDVAELLDVIITPDTFIADVLKGM
ncbi:E3 ubiquitin-protein ligase UBR4 [Popillia japonica]|uniref:E3 ubiquitin-protein ligase UBR4 n=1 Tax=Popillia japonica TaxID=7064 RepID=A0AAW1JUJ9_POPJA